MLCKYNYWNKLLWITVDAELLHGCDGSECWLNLDLKMLFPHFLSPDFPSHTVYHIIVALHNEQDLTLLKDFIFTFTLMVPLVHDGIAGYIIWALNLESDCSKALKSAWLCFNRQALCRSRILHDWQPNCVQMKWNSEEPLWTGFKLLNHLNKYIETLNHRFWLKFIPKKSWHSVWDGIKTTFSVSHLLSGVLQHHSDDLYN